MSALSLEADGSAFVPGGSGDDIFVLNTSKIDALQNPSGNAQVDGGHGTDVIQLAGGASFDLTAITDVSVGTHAGAPKIQSIEMIDLLTDTSANTLKLGLGDVLEMTEANLFTNLNGWTDGTYDLAAGGTQPEQRLQLVVKGGSNDTLDIGGADWTSVGTVSYQGDLYGVYNSGLNAQLLVDAHMQVI